MAIRKLIWGFESPLVTLFLKTKGVSTYLLIINK
nr:MAG TPA: hypothetical protein [Caudoviricetes sp.]